MWPNALLLLLVGNGLYDMACAAALLWFPRSPLSNFHLGIFRSPHSPPSHRPSPLAERMLAYWVGSAGITRLLAGYFYPDRGLLLAAGASFFFEAMAFSHEFVVNRQSMIAWKAGFTILLSVLFGIIVLMDLKIIL